MLSLSIGAVKRITPFYREDNRGFFLKNMEKKIFTQFGLNCDISEAFETYSRKGVIRGLHFQTEKPQAKLVRVLCGTINDVAVDLRIGSPTFGQHVNECLSETNHYALWIPEGFAHGFEVLSKYALVQYICVGEYLKECDTGILWNDKTLGIKWTTVNPIVSDKDSKLMTFQMFQQRFTGLKA